LQQYYLRARYYNQNTGRFSSLDPFAGSNFDPQSLHKYAYVYSDPCNNADPLGLLATSTLELQAVQVIITGLDLLILSTLLVVGYAVDLQLNDVMAELEIQHFVERHQDGSGITQTEYDELERTVRKTTNKSRRKMYLHYGFIQFAIPMLLNGLFDDRPQFVTKTVYPFGWWAKWYMALPQVEIQDAIYIIRPKRGYNPTGPTIVQPIVDFAGRPLPGTGLEWKFTLGTGGKGTVFGPIPIPQGHPPVWPWSAIW
jgi:YD repeat-containing protein